jgi:hypothetical protein
MDDHTSELKQPTELTGDPCGLCGSTRYVEGLMADEDAIYSVVRCAGCGMDWTAVLVVPLPGS